MKQTCLRWAMLISILVSLTFAGQTSAFWECEGRICSSVFLFCCCASRSTVRDANCGSLTGANAGACASPCNCSLTIQSLDEERAKRAGYFVASQVWGLPASSFAATPSAPDISPSWSLARADDLPAVHILYTSPPRAPPAA